MPVQSSSRRVVVSRHLASSLLWSDATPPLPLWTDTQLSKLLARPSMILQFSSAVPARPFAARVAAAVALAAAAADGDHDADDARCERHSTFWRSSPQRSAATHNSALAAISAPRPHRRRHGRLPGCTRERAARTRPWVVP